MTALLDMLRYIEKHGGTLLHHKDYQHYWNAAVREQNEQEAQLTQFCTENERLKNEKMLDDLDKISKNLLEMNLMAENARLQKALEEKEQK